MYRRRFSSSVELPCPFCGEIGAVFVDEGGGEQQTYVEDCTVCCRPRVVHVEHPEPESKRGPRVWLERA
jgi:cysteine-rich CPXCG protein